ncbi:hypothetical protein N9202_00045 [bacterium]|nr:hypothetical protein [bacterium]
MTPAASEHKGFLVKSVEPLVGIEPTTYSLRVNCSTRNHLIISYIIYPNADLEGAIYTDVILSNVTTNNQVLLNMIEIQKIQSQLALLADALAAKDAEIANKNERIAQLEDLSAVPRFNLLLEEKEEQIAALELRPTQAAYDAVVTEKDARPTLGEIQDARTGSVILTPSEDGTVQLKIEIEESSDLEVWENQGKSVEAGFPLAEGKKFLRFALK